MRRPPQLAAAIFCGERRRRLLAGLPHTGEKGHDMGRLPSRIPLPAVLLDEPVDVFRGDEPGRGGDDLEHDDGGLGAVAEIPHEGAEGAVPVVFERCAGAGDGEGLGVGGLEDGEGVGGLGGEVLVGEVDGGREGALPEGGAAGELVAGGAVEEEELGVVGRGGFGGGEGDLVDS